MDLQVARARRTMALERSTVMPCRRRPRPLPLLSSRSLAALALGAELFFLAGTAFGLDPDKRLEDYVVHRWSDENGLPHNLVWVVRQTRDGYLYLGTQEGLVRFDGVRFTAVAAPDEGSFTETSVRALAVAPADGTLYLSMLRDGIGAYRAGRLTRLADAVPETWTRQGVTDLLADSRGALWVAANGGLGRFVDERQFRVLRDLVPAADLTLQARQVREDREGRILFTSPDGLYAVERDDSRLLASVRGATALEVGPSGSVWIGTETEGVFHYDGQRATRLALPAEWTKVRILALREDRDGCVWIGSRLGLGRWSTTGKPRFEPMLADLEVQDLWLDTLGQLWVASRSGLIGIQDPPFRTWPLDGTRQVRSMAEDRDRVLWYVVSEPPRLYRREGSRIIPDQSPGAPALPIALHADQEGGLWLGAADGLYRRGGGAWRKVRTHDTYRVTCVHRDRSGQLWLADDAGRVHTPDDSVVLGIAQGLPGRQIWALQGTRDGTLWIATHDGLFRYASGRVAAVSLGSAPASRFVRNLLEDEDGTVWAGSRAGLSRIHGAEIATIGPGEGIPDAVVSGLVADSRGSLWVGCTRGVYRVRTSELVEVAAGQRSQLQSALYGRADGIREGLVRGPVALRRADGSLWFASGKVLVEIPDARQRSQSVPPVAHIEEVLVSGRRVSPLRAGSFGPADRHVAFQFTATSFDAPERLRFLSRLDAVDPRWNEASVARAAVYPHLGPGSYVFRVKAVNPRGVWGDEVTYAFTLAPHWYETRAAILLLVAGLLGLTYGGFALRVRALSWRERVLGLRVEQRTAELRTEIEGHRQTEATLAETNRDLSEQSLALEREVGERQRAEEELRRLNFGLEDRVRARTAELAQANRALLGEKERLAVTLASIADGVLATDIHGRILLMNRVAEQITAKRIAEVRGRPLGDVVRLIHPETREPLPDPVLISTTLGSTTAFTSTALLLLEGSPETVIAFSAAPIRDPDSKPRGVVVVMRDITERQRIERQLQHAEKLEALGLLAGGIAHDFNNLLTGVFGYISLARQRLGAEGPGDDALERALAVLDKARGLTRQLLTFSMAGEPMKKPIDLGALLQASVRFVLSGSTVACQLELASDLWHCLADEQQLGQVIDNLLLNSRQAMVDGGTIKVEAANLVITPGEASPLPPGKYVSLRVRDEGPGIPADIRHRIFEPFFTTKSSGTGLGLATAHSIVKKHNGWMELIQTPGVAGATFRICLPAADGAPVEAHDPTIVHSGAGRILVMDDEPYVRELACETLAALGYEAAAAGHGAEALELFERARGQGNPYDLVILDLTVSSGLGGVETLQHMKRVDPAVKALASSGYSSDDVLARPRRHGFIGSLVKPYTVAEMSRAIHEALGPEPPSRPPLANGGA